MSFYTNGHSGKVVRTLYDTFYKDGRYDSVWYSPEGKPYTRKFIEIKAVTDERICDGFYYASAFKLMRQYVEKPEQLLKRPEKVFEDID